MSGEKVVIGNATLFHADCREVLPTLGKFDLLLTDPPYGINENSAKVASRTNAAAARDYGFFDWDKQTPSPETMAAAQDAATWSAIWGGNYFNVPASSCWLVWDKLNTGDFADCELCWTNWPKAVRRIQWRWNGMIRQGNEERFHPTQKPLAVMAWALDLAPASATVLDCFMGSGTTGVACVQLGRAFTGIERERKYFDIACERISRAQAQGALFPHDTPAAPVQVGFDLEAEA